MRLFAYQDVRGAPVHCQGYWFPFGLDGKGLEIVSGQSVVLFCQPQPE